MSVSNLLEPNNFTIYAKDFIPSDVNAYVNEYLNGVTVQTLTPVIGTYYPVNLTGVADGGSSDFTVATVGAANLITYTGILTKIFKVSCTVSSSANVGTSRFDLELRKNGTTGIPAAQISQTSQVGFFSPANMEALVELSTGNDISVWVANATNINGMNLHDFSLTITEV